MALNEARFWRRVDRQRGDLCWEWVGARRPDGYGVLRVDGTQVRAHRVAYELEHGSIPAGLNVLHSCDNPPCVRPNHLRVGTQRDNMRDMDEKSRRYSPFRGQKQRGELNRNARITEDDVRTIRRRYAAGEGQKEIAADFGMNPANVSHIVRRKSWRHVT